MKNKNRWVDLSILGLCTVALLGTILRSKIVFALPFINYNHLLEAHAHFTFGGWVTLALMTLMVYDLLPAYLGKRPVYQWILGGIVLSSWSTMIAFLAEGYSHLSILLSLFFILLTYIFGWCFIRDILKANRAKPVLLLIISAVVCLIISSSGPFIIAYFSFTRSFDPILYRDALFTFLHFQYNGFFSLTIFALLFDHLGKEMTPEAQKNTFRFSVVLASSIVPTVFLSYLWQDPNSWVRVIAIGGSLLLLGSLFLLILSAWSLRFAYRQEKPTIRFLIFLSLGSFMLKSFLQSFTIWPAMGNAIFGNRPIIMGFLHLVFLGFVSLFILAFFAKKGVLDSSRRSTTIALLAFAFAVMINEALLIIQGLATMFIGNRVVFTWLLFAAAICLFAGTVLIALARIGTKGPSQ